MRDINARCQKRLAMVGSTEHRQEPVIGLAPRPALVLGVPTIRTIFAVNIGKQIHICASINFVIDSHFQNKYSHFHHTIPDPSNNSLGYLEHRKGYHFQLLILLPGTRTHASSSSNILVEAVSPNKLAIREILCERRIIRYALIVTNHCCRCATP